MLRHMMPAIRATLLIAFLSGLFFPALITVLAQLMFPDQANGSLLRNHKGEVIGSKLIGQNFSRREYFHPRPSAAGSGYAGEASSGTNLGPTSAKLFLGQSDDPASKDIDESFAGVKQLAEKYREENHFSKNEKVPVDAVTRSGSGLDPHISQANALMQARRIAKARSIDLNVITDIIEKHTESRDLGIFGEPRVNVLMLNLALDQLGR
ncbi:MAG: potassium-transporting ATPase subunit C [Candidatus Melainabacteria bacterium]|nr:MAG: potassium-transporting ATPase subunit C [Candidatus Melainabacteria bacterium]